MKKKLISALLCTAMTVSLLAGCGSSNSGDAGTTPPAGDNAQTGTTGSDTASADAPADGEMGEVYFLNFKPEDAETFEKKIMPAFTEETGIKATVMTAAANSYGPTLKAELAKAKMPTLFQIGNYNGYLEYKDYAMDLSNTEFYNRLTDKSLAITGEDGGVYAVPYTVEGYGIIANKKLIADYCALDGAKIASIDEINSFAKLKEVAEDMQARKDDLGIAGAFASTSFSPGEEWRWTTHLANVPLYYDLVDQGVDDSPTLTGKYTDNLKQIFDLYINNSCTAPTMLSSKTVVDSMAEFALGEAVFTQNGNWAWGDISSNNPDMTADDITFLPIYIGVDGEENQGLCVGTEGNWAVNSQVSEADQNASLAFVDWLFTSETGKAFCKNELGYTVPQSSFTDADAPENPLAKAVVDYAAAGKTSVAWSFNYMPSQTFKDNLGAAMLEYAQGTADWSGVEKAFVEGWKQEKASPTPD